MMFVAICCALTLLMAGGTGKVSAATPRPVDISLRPLERETSLDGLTIIVPTDPEWRKVGEQLIAAIKSIGGSRIHLQEADEKLPELWSGNTLLIGNLGNNGYISRLYGMRYAFADAVYPGKGGYQLHTLVNPFGHVGNTIILGASDLSGLHKGASRLAEILRSADQDRLPWLHEADLADSIGGILGFLPNVDDLLSKFSPEENNYNTTLTVLKQASIAGENFHLTGSRAAGLYYKKIMLSFADFINTYPEAAKRHLNNGKNIWTRGHAFYAAWTVNEPSPIFTEEERKRIVSAIYVVVAANSNDPYLPKASLHAPRNNHDTYPALSLMTGASYFCDYYPELLSVAQGWYDLGKLMFTNNTAVISRDDGSDYMMHVPQTLLDYALIVGDHEIMDYGLRASADLHAIMVDNLGVMAGGGDMVAFGNSSALHFGHSAIMNAAAWYYGDTRYRNLLDRVRYGPFPDQAMSDLKRPFHRYKTTVKGNSGEQELNQPLVQAYPLDAGVYDDLMNRAQVPIAVRQYASFHKLGFRQGFGSGDSYLLIDGTAAGAHNHEDANTILRYTDHGRMFIDVRDYIERGPEHKTGMVIIKDGVQDMKPSLAKVDWIGDVGGIAISKTTLPDYSGTDWQRTVISPGGTFYLICDQVKIKQQGSYTLENVWQTLGDLKVFPDRFQVEQQGVTMTLQSLDDSELRTYSRPNHFKQYYQRRVPYPFANGENVLREVKKEAVYDEGDSVRFMNILSSTASDKPVVEAVRINEHAVNLVAPEGTWLAIWGEHANTEQFQSDGTFYLMNGHRLLIAGARHIHFRSLELSFDEPILFGLDADSMTWTAYSLKKDLIFYDENGDPFPEGIVRTGTHRLGMAMLTALQRQLTVERVVPKKIIIPSVNGSPTGWRELYAFDSEVAASTVADLDGNGSEELILGGSDGEVRALNQDGQLLWRYETHSPINELTVQQVDGKPVVTVANENWHAHVLDGAGNLIWSKHFVLSRPQSHGNLIGITNIRMAYVNGYDREPWYMLASSFNHLYGVDTKGYEVYNQEAYHYGIIDMQFADYGGSGKDMGALGMEYYFPALLTGTGPISRVVIRVPGWKVVRTVPGANPPSVVMGTKEHTVHLLRYSGNTFQEQWKVNVGGEVNDIIAGDFKGTGSVELIVGSGGHQVYSLDERGKVNWRTAVGDRVLKVNAVFKNDAVHYLAGLDNGQLVQLSKKGEILSKTRFPTNIQNILTSDKRDSAWIVLQNGEVYIDDNEGRGRR